MIFAMMLRLPLSERSSEFVTVDPRPHRSVLETTERSWREAGFAPKRGGPACERRQHKQTLLRVKNRRAVRGKILKILESLALSAGNRCAGGPDGGERLLDRERPAWAQRRA